MAIANPLVAHNWSILDSALWAYRRGYYPVMVRPRAKKAFNPGWQEHVYDTEQEVINDFSNEVVNLGLRWGGEPGLVDIDMENVTVAECAQYLLPETDIAWGRASKPHSHRVFQLIQVPEAQKTKKFKDPWGNLVLEMRGSRSQSVIPPSIHPGGEQYMWDKEPGEPHRISMDDLETAVRETIFASAFAVLWPGASGNRHEASLGIIGLLAKAGKSEDRIARIMQAILEVGKDPDPHDRLQMIAPTVQRYLAGEAISGSSAVGDALGPEVAQWAGKILQVRAERLLAADFPLNDKGNTLRFIKKHGKEFLYLSEKNKWLVWKGTHWAEALQDKEVYQSAMQLQEIVEEELPSVNGAAERAELSRFALKSGNIGSINAVVALAQKLLAREENDFDTDNLLLNLPNGTLDLRTLELRDHDPEELHSRLATVMWKEDAECPKWLAFLNQIFRGDTELISWIQKVCGYCLTGKTGEQCLFFLYGSGKNGKSTFVNVLSNLMGTYWTSATTESLMMKGKTQGNGIGNDLAMLAGARFVSTNELEGNRRWSEAMLKSLTGGDFITARFLWGEYFVFVPKMKLFTFGNAKPPVSDTSEGFWRRMRLIPFLAVIPPEDRVQDYHDVLLKEEGPGILRWMAEGCQRWQAEGLGTNATVQEATDEYRQSENIIRRFIDENYEVVKPSESKEPQVEVWGRYKLWALEEAERAASHRKFTEELLNIDFGDGRKIEEGRSKNNKFYKGLRAIPN